MILKELYLLYNEDFFASTSDFWWDRIHKASFGGCIANFMLEAFVIVYTGSPVSFFANPYVQDWLRNLDPAHRPI